MKYSLNVPGVRTCGIKEDEFVHVIIPIIIIWTILLCATVTFLIMLGNKIEHRFDD